MAEVFNYGLQGKLFGSHELIFIHIYNNTSFLYPQMWVADDRLLAQGNHAIPRRIPSIMVMRGEFDFVMGSWRMVQCMVEKYWIRSLRNSIDDK